MNDDTTGIRLLDDKIVAERLSITRGALAQARRRGVLWGKPCPEFVKLPSGRVRYPEHKLNEWIASLNYSTNLTDAYSNEETD